MFEARGRYSTLLIPLKPEYQEFPLEKANEALMEVHQSKIRGAKVLRIG